MMNRVPLLLTSCLLLTTPALAEDLPWSAANSISASGAVMLAAGDLDGDTDIDIVSVDEAGNLLTVHLNDGDGTSWTSTSTAMTSPVGVALADHGNDGDLDIVVSSSSAALIQLWENPGAGSGWVISNWSANSWGGGDVDFVDLDNDGGSDLLVNAVGGGNTYVTAFGPAGEVYGSFILGGGPGTGTAVDGGDIDRDGDTDSIMISTDSVSVVTNPGNDYSTSTFSYTAALVATLDSARDGELADVDGDGWLDIVVSAADGTGDTLVWYANAAGTVSGTAQTILASAGGADRISTVDLDRDGDIDVLLSAGTDGDVLFMENIGDGASWTTRTVNASLTGATHSISADIDGDGDNDVIAAGSGSVVWHENQRLHTTVSFGTEVAILTGASGTQRIGFGDLDFDGDLDLIGGDSSTGVAHWINNLSGANAWGTPTTLMSFLSNYRMGLAFDIDSDGDVDPIAVINNGSPNLVSFENLRTGGYGTGTTVPGAGAATAMISVGDVDNDGDQDIVRGVNSGGEVIWMRNNGGGSWNNCTIGDFATSNDTLLADFDGDGDLDVVAQDNSAPDGSQLLINTGICGTWTTQVTIQGAVQDGMGNLAAGDLDGDGDLDFITASSSHGLNWYDNPGSPLLLTGAWVANVIDGSPPGRTGVKVADLDLDGDLDVIAGGGGTVVWYENTGTFASAWPQQTLNVSAGNGSYAMPIDLNGDGRVDLAWSGGDGHGWAPMQHQQASATGTAVAPTCVMGAACIEEGDSAAVLTIDVAHMGRATDVDIELGVIDLLLESASSAMSDAEAASAFAEISIWSDDTGTAAGALDAGDTQLASVTSFTLSAGVLSIALPSTGDSAVSALGTKTFLVVAEASGTAVNDTITDIDITWQPAAGSAIHYEGTDFLVGLDGSPVSTAVGFTIVPIDSDDDGDPDTSDCDDTDATVFTGATETCNLVDDDCDTFVDEDFDTDSDLYFDDTDAGCVTTYGGAGLLDCDDTDTTINPTITEICDGVDEDCDTAIDNGFDADADTYFTVSDAGCVATYSGTVGTDCDDAVFGTNPGATEACDGVDQDCDGTADQTFDVDVDLAYDGSDAGCVTTYGAAAVDCDDAVATTNPSATETCNLVDDDCNTVVDNGFDTDNDTFFAGTDAGCVTTYGGTVGVDCDDGDATQFPGATEVCNRADDDCDGSTTPDETDDDNDTFVECEANSDCDDNDASQFPGATEVCNGEDDDCDSTIDDGFDVDNDGFFTDANAGCVSTYGATVDCDDAVASTNTGATEVCDAVDQDCDGTVDDGFDVDADGVTTCGPDGNPSATGDNDCDDTDSTTNPTLSELCDAIDNDCDGTVDDGLDTDGDGITPCGANGVVDGTGAATDDDCDDAEITSFPGATEACDFVDSDCDGSSMKTPTSTPICSPTASTPTTTATATWTPTTATTSTTPSTPARPRPAMASTATVTAPSSTATPTRTPTWCRTAWTRTTTTTA